MTVYKPDTRVQKSNLLILVNEKKRRQALKSLYFMTKYVLGYNLLHAVPHGEICEWMEETMWDESIFLIPRGNYKSSIGSVAFIIWMLARNPELRIMLSSAEHANTKGWLGEIKNHCEFNEDFRELFGDWVPKRAVDRDKGWTATALRIRPSKRKTATPSVVATSSGISKVSQHYDLAICDDLMNDKTSTSREQVDAQERYLQLLVPILDPPIAVKDNRKKDTHGPRKIIGTRWGHDDLYIRLLTRDDHHAKTHKTSKHWKRFIRKAYTKDYAGNVTKVFFPAVFTVEYLEGLKRSSGMSNYHFSCQYLNDPQPDEERTFKLKDLGFWNKNGRTLTPAEKKLGLRERVVEMPHLKRFFTACDPAGSDEENADFTAIVTTSVSQDRKRFIYDVTRGQWRAPSKIIEELVRVFHAFNPLWIGIEEVTFGLYLQSALTKVFRETGVAMPVRPLKPRNRSKEKRIRGLEPFVSDGNTFLRLPDDVDLVDYIHDTPVGWEYDREALLNLLGPGMAELAEELLKYPTAPHRDTADALAYHVTEFDVSPDAATPHAKKEGTFTWWQNMTPKRKFSPLS